jgi:hypothetical protein
MFKGTYCPSKTKKCRNWYQLAGTVPRIALVLGSWTFFFHFEGTPPWILQRSFAAT